MSTNNTFPTLLEHLPVEILQQIFGLLPLRDISTAFCGLNLYVDSIIRSMTNAHHIVSCNDVNSINLLHLFPTLISHLVIVNVETVDFTSLRNLRSLMLKYGTQAQLDSIRPQNYPMLEIFQIKGNES
ncbi:unnamed protein product [Adineta steineri]|uniref:F-box domain-containing protein n=1 Tax=Adineta steineri TaxID=433720 RepID=A0A814NVD9_9BILA|nr:unnamed protein product [Adineta steineri]CAF3863007.1 unnamed protein product [Adineta steineri]